MHTISGDKNFGGLGSKRDFQTVPARPGPGRLVASARGVRPAVVRGARPRSRRFSDARFRTEFRRHSTRLQAQISIQTGLPKLHIWAEPDDADAVRLDYTLKHGFVRLRRAHFGRGFSARVVAVLRTPINRRRGILDTLLAVMATSRPISGHGVASDRALPG